MEEVRAASAKQVRRPSVWDGFLNKAFYYLFPLLLLTAMTVQTRTMSFILTGFAVLAMLSGSAVRNLRQVLCVPLLGFLFFALMNLAAAVYAPVGVTATKEAVKILASFSLSIIVVLRFKKEHVRYLLWTMGGVSAFLALLCVDAGCDGALFSGFRSLMGMLGADYSSVTIGTAEGTRVNGIYNDGNVSASIQALANLILLYLIRTTEQKKAKFAACFLLGVNAMAFFLAVSRGAIICFCIALLVYLIASKKGTRMSLFLLMLETAVVTVMLSAIAMLSLGTGSMFPDLLTLLCGVLVFGLDELLGERVARLLVGKEKLITAVVMVLVIAMGAFLAAAVSVTGPQTFAEDGTLTRSAKLTAGEYTLSVQWEGTEPQVLVYTQSSLETLHGTWTELYQGSASDCSFTVAEDGPVDVQFTASAGTTLQSAVFSDGTSLKLHYKLLPEFAAARLQDSLLESHSTQQRWQYDLDGFQLFLRHPLLGYGLGSSEAWLFSVQPYYYESNYVHNHLLQVMDDMGLVGLVGFVMLLGGVLWLLLKNLKQERDALTAVLLACWVMMNAHGLMEINFSIRAYQCMAYSLLMLVVVCYGKPLLEKEGNWLGVCAAALACVQVLTLGTLLWNDADVNRIASNYSTNSADAYLRMLKKLIDRDVLDPEDFEISYIAQAMVMEGDTYQAQMETYVKRLRESRTYVASIGLARYYYLPTGQLDQFFETLLEGIQQIASNPEGWNQMMVVCRSMMDSVQPEQAAQVAAGVQSIGQALDAWNVGRVETITLSEENQNFLAAAEAVRTQNLTGDDAYQLLASAVGNLS